jgi:hypothetical protein
MFRVLWRSGGSASPPVFSHEMPCGTLSTPSLKPSGILKEPRSNNLYIFAGRSGRALAYRRFRSKPLIEALLAVPLVLPPTVVGFYLLVGLGGQCFDSPVQ